MDLKKKVIIVGNEKNLKLNSVEDYERRLKSQLPLSAFVLEDTRRRDLYFAGEKFTFFLSLDDVSNGFITFNVFDSFSDGDGGATATIPLPESAEVFEKEVIFKLVPKLFILALSVFLFKVKATEDEVQELLNLPLFHCH